ncbi:hypothetical protein CB1_000394025 [Camelus ferus]|nr:hypothetical protein CB1_000394025 [Camelus ferus]
MDPQHKCQALSNRSNPSFGEEASCLAHGDSFILMLHLPVSAAAVTGTGACRERDGCLFSRGTWALPAASTLPVRVGRRGVQQITCTDHAEDIVQLREEPLAPTTQKTSSSCVKSHTQSMGPPGISIPIRLVSPHWVTPLVHGDLRVTASRLEVLGRVPWPDGLAELGLGPRGPCNTAFNLLSDEGCLMARDVFKMQSRCRALLYMQYH